MPLIYFIFFGISLFTATTTRLTSFCSFFVHFRLHTRTHTRTHTRDIKFWVFFALKHPPMATLTSKTKENIYKDTKALWVSHLGRASPATCLDILFSLVLLDW